MAELVAPARVDLDCVDLDRVNVGGVASAADADARLLRRIAFSVVLLVVWHELAAGRSAWLPGPLAVLRALVDGLRDGALGGAMFVSLQRIAVAYAIAVALGVTSGVIAGRSRGFDDTVGALLRAFDTLPSLCWLPVATVALGRGERAIVLVVASGALAAIALAVGAGVRRMPTVYLQAARSLGVTGMRLYTAVVVPAAQPAIVGGLRRGWSVAWRSLIAVEMLAATRGLGSVLHHGDGGRHVADVAAAMLLVFALGTVVDRAVFGALVRRADARWGTSAAALRDGE